MREYPADPLLAFLVGMIVGAGLMAAVLVLLGKFGGC